VRQALLILAGALAALTSLASSAQAQVAYPHGYREWLHVKTMHVRLGHPLHATFGGIHHVYANKKAAEGLKRGKFSNGSTLVLDLLEPRDEAFATSEGARKLVAVMHKDTKQYAATGGWGFEAFRGDNRKERLVGRQALAACFGCHAEQKRSDYVFSTLRN
jgi:hypothetical protein